MNSKIVILAGLTLAAPSWLHGQDTLATVVQYGERVTDQLTPDHPVFEDGSFYKIYGFEGARGDSVSISLMSEDLDAFLILGSTQGNEVSRDGDSGGLCSAHIATVLPDSGWYAIYAAGTAAGEWGDFTLTLDRGLTSPPSDAACRGFIGPMGILTLGDSVTSSLGQDDPFLRDSTYYEVWLLGDTRGKTFSVDFMSQDVDAVLMLLRGFARVVAVDDDGGGNCNSRIVYENGDGAPLRLVARTRGNWQMGSFVLRLTEGAKAPNTTSPCEGRPAGRPPAPR